MNFVEPIRDTSKIYDICDYLRKKNERDYIMFLMGIYTGLRISDILKLKVKDVKGKRFINVKETKTSKHRQIEFNLILKGALDEYCKDKDPDDYLIKSREQYNKSITRDMAYKILNYAAELFGLQERIGCHTMRKTFGYHYYKQTGDVVTLQKIFNHDHPSITLRYIGIDQDAINKALRTFKF